MHYHIHYAIVTAKGKALEQTTGLPLRGGQILCVITEWFRVNSHAKDYKHIVDLNNVSLRGDDVLGFITKWDDILLHFDPAHAPPQDQQLVLLQRKIAKSKSLTIYYTRFLKECDEDPGFARTMYAYLQQHMHNHIRRDRATDVRNEFCDPS